MAAVKTLLTLALAASGIALSGAAVPQPAQPAPRAAVRQLAIVDRVDPKQAARSTERQRSAYLLAYFKDETHSLHFATSPDGYSFTDVNNGEPVLSGRDIADQKGIRDPHIARGPDGAFYLSMTDLHIFAKREGLRSTDWERPNAEFGWGNNRGLIFMKSYDLIHWTHHIVRVDTLFPETARIGTAWAPQTIYDPAKRRMMVYYSTRDGRGRDHMVYSYADPAFTTLTEVPKDLFTYPVADKGTIDGDITRIGNKYHLFYVAHDKPGYLRQAVSDRINGGYVYNPTKIDPETVATEAPSLWRRHGTDRYVLMYDVFGAKPVNTMGFSETRDFVHFRNLGRFNEPGSPMKATNFRQAKHGAVMGITPAELRRIEDYFRRRGVSDGKRPA